MNWFPLGEFSRLLEYSEPQARRRREPEKQGGMIGRQEPAAGRCESRMLVKSRGRYVKAASEYL